MGNTARYKRGALAEITARFDAAPVILPFGVFADEKRTRSERNLHAFCLQPKEQRTNMT
jgi:hypothetical protein